MHYNKYIIVLSALFFIAVSSECQPKERGKVKIGLEITASEFAHSQRWNFRNENARVYKELRVNFKFNQLIEAGIFAGNEHKNYLYFKQLPNRQMLLSMTRQYFPAGIYGRINITDVFYEKLKLIKRREKWDIYNQLIIGRMDGYDTRDENDDGQNILYIHPYVIPYNRIYLGFMAGVKYHASPKLSFFIEAGEGTLVVASIGAGFQF